MVLASSSVVSTTKKTTSLKSLRRFHDASSDNLKIVVGANKSPIKLIPKEVT